MENLNLLTLISKSLLEQNIDLEVTFQDTDTGVKTFVELSDLATGTPVGIAKGNDLEDALATILGRFAGQSRDIKLGRINTGLTEL